MGAFYGSLHKIHPRYVNWAHSSAMKTCDRHTQFCEKAPQKASTYDHHVNVKNPGVLILILVIVHMIKISGDGDSAQRKALTDWILQVREEFNYG